MLNRIGPVLICAAWLAATAAMAQAPPPQGDIVAGVTVQAAPGKPAEAQKQAKSFVQTYAKPTAAIDQFARWDEPVCVAVVGLIPAQASAVAARVEDVARALGLKTLKPGCAANIEIEFADQPQRLLDWVADHRSQMLGFHYPVETKTLKTVTRPIQAWYKTATRSDAGARSAGLAFASVADGSGTAIPNPGSLPGQSLGGATVDDPAIGTPGGCAESRLSSCLQSVFANVLVVIDNAKLQGRDLGAVSDYLAMLALSQPRSLDGCAALSSVIDLFAPASCSGREAPDGLTPADAAYLTALYGADPKAKKAGEQSDIANRMSRILVKATREQR